MLECFFAIINITVCLTKLWLAGNCHIISNYKWYVRSMRRIVDELDLELESIEEEGVLIMNEEFMMGILKGIMHELTTFK